ncbi:hypothetical protein OKA04_22645 [Luteolibacter flavescens]|uniref:Uncharacterized protein n=1 Tax=Luteolibacter flavescens TaxID=1859460 RepID=A0ABT3FVD3_9BACT|nr:hypothetical protein [Luteolibacter flavescens]MCW1887553.1 hypothetical protein [Luteolibacter flavescens]
MDTPSIGRPQPSIADSGFIPLEARVVLVDAILEFETAEAAREKLREIGIKRGIRAVMNWLQSTRQWLGLGDFYPRANVPSYREAVQRWIAKNGRPSPRQILSGWAPAGALQARS